MVISYIYICNANQKVQNRSKIKEPKIEDGDNECLFILNNNIVMIVLRNLFTISRHGCKKVLIHASSRSSSLSSLKTSVAII